ncbi:thioredoxin domain-containing protein [Chlorobium limicola]
MKSGKTHTNRLAQEKSPYLLQHAGNPVNWLPWGEEAFAEARERDLPIFLSIGYATCHWCHVMERESFENHGTAELLNRYFIPVKADREEHPDLDRLYMTYVQASTGRGGWPMSVWLTPDLQPFYGGSYFPPEDRYGMPGFGTLLRSIAELWSNDPARIKAAAAGFFEQIALTAQTPSQSSAIPGNAAENGCFEWLQYAYDPSWGGFGPAPKFPRPALITFLFSYAARNANREAASMALYTLRRMAEGGIHDHIWSTGKGGGGFSRYATDARWHVPHFEKMLYDNAQLAVSYLDAFRMSGERYYASVAENIFNYVLHDLRSPDGGFYSAEDADSYPEHGSTEKKEGAFYIWSLEELRQLPIETAALELFILVCGIDPDGNVREDPHGEFDGKNVLMHLMAPEKAAKLAGVPADKAIASIDTVRELLYLKRLKRPRPFLDDKIITSWNGLMISALSQGFNVLGNHEYLDAARKATDFIFDRIYREKEGTLLRRYRDGEAAIPGKAEDYACFIRGLLDLYQASFEERCLEYAQRLCDKQNELFYDDKSGGYFSTASTDTSVPARLKEEYDGAEPAAASVSVRNLLDIAAITGNDAYRDMAEQCLKACSGILSERGNALPLMLTALDYARKGGLQATVSGDMPSDKLREILQILYARYLPDMTVQHISATNVTKPTITLCRNRSCMPPVSSPEELRQLLDTIR